MCQNMNLLLGVTRRLAVGLSEVAGWGCFVMEDIKEGEYIVRSSLVSNSPVLFCNAAVLCRKRACMCSHVLLCVLVNTSCSI